MFVLGKIGNLVGLYAKNPARFFRHAGNGLKSLVAEGPSAFTKKVGIVFDIARSAKDDEVVAKALKQRSKELLETYQASGDHLFEAVYERLKPFVPNESEINSKPDRAARIKAFTEQMLSHYHLFDEGYYLSKYLSGKSVTNALDHYLSIGQFHGFWPNPFFDPIDYLLTYPEVAKSGVNPVIHFTFFGSDLGYVAGQLFDPGYYLKMNEDVAESVRPPFAHFLETGRGEGRRPYPFAGHSELKQLAHKWGRGTILIVSHDAEVGGAQTIALNFARWLNISTLFSVKILLMRGGPNLNKFKELAPIFDYEGHEKLYGADLARSMFREFAGSDIQCVLLNSIASGRFFDIWEGVAPVVSYLHELPQIISHYGDNIEKVLKGSAHVVSGSHAVQNSLLSEYAEKPRRYSVVYDHVESFELKPEIGHAEKAIAKAKIGIDEEAIMVLACGTVHWRKRPDLFIDVADKVLRNSDAKYEFVWIGDGEDFAECKARVEALGWSDRIHLVGYQSELDKFFDACDIFLLPSEEDPFPIVVLFAALSCAPTVCFDDAGGIPEFAGTDHGRSVPFLNVNAMVDGVLAYGRDSELRLKHGRNARLKAMRDHTLLSTGPQLLEIIRQEAGLKPIVSVIMPNYNYEDFLNERLASIQHQTFQDFEVILLDDKSSDDSVEIMKEFALLRPGTQLIENDKNSGSPFRQWFRGIEEAQADIIWLAEADDRAEPVLLETLLPAFEDRNVFLSYGKSIPIDKDGMVLGDYEEIYLDRINVGRWSKPYVCSDHEEMSNGLGIGNCIPNASAVLFRKFELEPEFKSRLTEMKLCGDWYFYCRAIRGGRIAYSSRPVNLHRRHDSTVTNEQEGTERYFRELQTVRSYVATNYTRTDWAKGQIGKFVSEDLNRFGVEDEAQRSAILTRAVASGTQKTIPSLAVVMPDASPGGGQVFAISLANQWAEMGGRVALFNVGQLPDHPAVMARIHPNVSYYDFRELPRPFSSYLIELDIDVIQSSIWWADRHVLDSLGDVAERPVWVTTMHGCAESILDNPDIDPGFEDRFRRMLDMADAFVYTAEKNQNVFSKFRYPEKLVRINNGIKSSATTGLTRDDLGIRPSSLLLCLAARAIAEKGWREAVELTRRLNSNGVPADLLLIGEGPLADEIRTQSLPYIHCVGQVSDLQNYLSLSDICLLPSYFVGESFPLVILESLGFGTPVITSDVGELRSIVGEGDEASGLIVPLINGRVDIQGMYDAVITLADPGIRQKYAMQARKKFEAEYRLERMVEKYLMLYQSLLAPEDESSL